MPQNARRRRFRLVAAWMMALCFLVAAGRLVVGAAPALDPALAAGGIDCTFWSCRLERDPRRLLARVGAEAPAAHAPEAVASLIAAPPARTLIAASALVAAIPTALMFAALGFAFRRLRAPGRFAEAAAWLRRAAMFALLAVALRPVATTLLATAMSPLTTGRRQLFVYFEAPEFLWGLMLAGSAWVAVWVLEQALAAERELEEIV